MKTCFECGGTPCEEHHVVPESLGGTKTVPLCARCHGLVHGLTRTDSTSTLTRIGIATKYRFWEHFAIYQLVNWYDFDFDNIAELHHAYKEKFEDEISLSSFKSLCKTYQEMTDEQRTSMFNRTLPDEFMHLWDDEIADARDQKKWAFIRKLQSEIESGEKNEEMIALYVEEFLNGLNG